MEPEGRGGVRVIHMWFEQRRHDVLAECDAGLAQAELDGAVTTSEVIDERLAPGRRLRGGHGGDCGAPRGPRDLVVGVRDGRDHGRVRGYVRDLRQCVQSLASRLGRAALNLGEETRHDRVDGESGERPT